MRWRRWRFKLLCEESPTMELKMVGLGFLGEVVLVWLHELLSVHVKRV